MRSPFGDVPSRLEAPGNRARADRTETGLPTSTQECALASDEARYVNGHDLVVDGGWRAK